MGTLGEEGENLLDFVSDGQGVVDNQRGLGAPDYYVVRPINEVRGGVREELGVWASIGRVVERFNANFRRVLRAPGLSEERIAGGLETGNLRFLSRAELLAMLPREKSGVGITGGGDCAGIADCLSALAKNLNPNMAMMGVRNAGEGLVKKDENFSDGLIVVDPLMAEDFRGQSSTPFGSSRIDPLKSNREQTLKNIEGRPFFYGTGGNDHLALLERIAKEFPEMPVVGTFKSIDGDGCVNGKPAQMLGFNTASSNYREAIYSIAQSAATHGQVDVVEVFGRNCGKLAFESARPDVEVEDRELARKMEEFGDTVLILVPEEPVSLEKIAMEVKRRKEESGSCVVVVAEGFLPPEMRAEIKRLSEDNWSGQWWRDGELGPSDLLKMIEDPVLKQVLEDPNLLNLFGHVVWNEKRDAYGNNIKLSGIRSFIIEAIKKLASIPKVNELMQNYEARGASPTEYDSTMGQKIGAKMAELINDGVKGGKAVVYFEGMDAMTEDPVVVDLTGVSDKNNLHNEGVYSKDGLRRGGVFW